MSLRLVLALIVLPLVPSVAAASAPWADAAELERRLADLASPTGADRASAERWLGTHVSADDFPALAAAAQRGDVEVRGRLARAVGSDGRNLALAVLFLREPREELSHIGERAIEGMASRFNPDLSQPGIVGSDLRTVLFEMGRRSAPLALQLDARETIDRCTDLLRTGAKVPVGLVRAPGLRERSPKESESLLIGAWEEVVLGLAQFRAVALEAHGIDRDLEKARGFLVWVSPIDSGRKTGVELIIEWCRIFSGPAGPERVAAARALAASEWPAALGWMERTWRANADPAALEGLLLAASDGRVAIALSEPRSVKALLEMAAKDLASGDAEVERGHRILRALEQVGCRGPRGEDLAAAAFEGFASATEAGRWLRFALIEQWACGGSQVARDAARRVIGDGNASAALRVQALRAWASLTASAGEELEPPQVAAPESLVRWATDASRARELAALLASCGEVPPSWTTRINEQPYPQSVALGWQLGGGDVEAAAASLALASDADSLFEAYGSLLRSAVAAGERRRVDAVLERARTLAPDRADVFDRISLLAGATIDANAFGKGRKLADEPLTVLGVLAGAPLDDRGEDAVRSGAQQVLVERLQTALRGGLGYDANRPLLAAFERTLEELYGASDDLGSEVLLANVARIVGASRSTLRSEILAHRWPPPPHGAAEDLAQAARRWRP